MTVAHLDGFLGELARRLRAADTYGQLDALSDEKLLDGYLLAPEARKEISVFGDIDAKTEGRLRAFFETVAGVTEARTGVMTSYILDMSHEGFGRVVIFAGRLVLLAETLRDAQRFGFPSLDELAAHGEKLDGQAVAAFETYPEVARDDG
jgi:probable nitrogen fixation protein